MITRLTRTEVEVAECIAKGWACPRISEYLGVKTGTVRKVVSNMALKFPPHGDLRGYARVLYQVTR